MSLTKQISTPRGSTKRQAMKKTIVRAERRSLDVLPAKRPLAKVASVLTAMQTLPAFAIVDDRLNGDGTGLPLGINDGALGIILATVPLAIFGLYFVAGKQDASIVAGGKDDDSGLSL